MKGKKIKFSKRVITVSVVIAAAGLLLYHLKSGDVSSKVIARVGDKAITVKDFQREISGQSFQDQGYLDTMPGKKEFLELLIRREVILNEAEKAGFYKDPEVKRQLEEIQDALRYEAKKAEERIVVTNFFRHLREKDISVLDDEVEDYWKEEVEIQVSHILVSTPAIAVELLSRIKGGESFKKLAIKYSEDVASREQGGDLGYFMRGSLVPEVEEAAFALELGEVSEVVKSPFGYHVLMKTGERKLSGKPLEDTADKIRMVLEKQKFQAYIEKLKNRTNIKVNESVLDAVRRPKAYSFKGSEYQYEK